MYSSIKKIEFVFSEAFDAHPFVKMLMDSGITDLTMKTSLKDYTCTVTYEINGCNIDAQEAIDFDLDFFTGRGYNRLITPNHRIMTMAQIIEAAYLAGFEPSSDDLTGEALFIEAREFLLSTK